MSHQIKEDELFNFVTTSRLASSTSPSKHGGKVLFIENKVTNTSINSHIVVTLGYGSKCIRKYVGNSIKMAIKIYNSL